MIYAIIENEECVNAIVCDEVFGDSQGYVPLPDGFGIGDTYRDGEWVKNTDPTPELSEEEVRNAKIAELKRRLSDTDYEAIKYAEGWITEEDYAEMKAQREAWRNEIRELED